MNIFDFIPEPAQEPAKDSVVTQEEESGYYQMTIWDYLIPWTPCPLGF